MKKKSIKTGKSLLAFLLAAVMVLAMIPAVAVHAETATYDVGSYKGEKTTAEWTYPTQDGKVFAGWFIDETYAKPYTETTGNAYAKFVDAGLMAVKFQFNSDATVNSNTVNIRFLTAIKDTKLTSVTFNVALESQDKSWTMTETKCYSSVLEGSATVATSASTIFGSDATYFVVHTLNNVPKAVYGENFTAYVSWKTLDGTVVTGATRTFNVNDELSQETAPDTSSWTTVSGYTTVNGFINVNGTVDRDNETSSSVTFTTSEGSADNQLLCQFADAAANVKAFEISTTVQPDATGRRGVGFKTPDGYLFFNVVDNGGANGAGYVEFNVSNGSKTSQAYQALDAAAEAVITGGDPYTLKLVATNLTGETTDTVTFYVNDIAVYTYTDASGWDLTEKILPAIGVRGSGANATFTDYTFKVVYEESDQDDTQETAPDTSSWTTVSGYTTVNGFINVNGTVDRDNETSSSVTFTTSEGSADNQLLCQFAEAAQNVKSFEISTTVTAGTGRRGVGFKTPDGYLFFNVIKNGSANGVGYVEFNVSNGSKASQAYTSLSTEAEAVVAGTEAYTLKIVAENLTGTSSDTITLYVNDIAVYTYTNTLDWDLTAKVLPAIGVRGSGANATFTNYTFKVQYE